MVHPVQVYAYLELFMFGGRPIKNIANLEGNITLLCDSDDGLPGLGHDDKVDIAPLIRLHKRCPKFILEIQDGLAYTEEEIPAVLDVHKNETWWTYFDKAVTHVLVQPGHCGVHLEIVVDPEYQEQWMDTEPRTTRRREKREWVQRKGLKFCDMDVDVLVGRN